MGDFSPVPQQKVPICIVVATAYFTYVGRAVVDDKNNIVIHECSNIRRYGTTRGLGELALEGPKINTILDKSGTVRVPSHAVILTLECNQAVWENRL